jgi:hypothetical protein
VLLATLAMLTPYLESLPDAALAQTMTVQAQAIAFIDNFKLMMFVSFLAIPLVILVQRPRRPLGNAGPIRIDRTPHLRLQ